MAYVNSDKIRVFPCANRSSQYISSSRVTTEYNIVSLINKLSNKDSFVVSCETLASEQGDVNIVFNIHGYIFETTGSAIIEALGNNVTFNSTPVPIYASIQLEITNSSDNISLHSEEIRTVEETSGLLINLDINDGFTGLNISTDEPSLGTHQLKLFNVTKNADDTYLYSVPEESYIRFETSNYPVVVIDDGDLDTI